MTAAWRSNTRGCSCIAAIGVPSFVRSKKNPRREPGRMQDEGTVRVSEDAHRCRLDGTIVL
jgi:hypothetical protein